MAKGCIVCGETGGFLSGMTFVTIKGKDHCSNCADKLVTDSTSGVKVTTTPSIDGYKIIEYLDIESVEIVIGTGVFSEFSTSISDFFGARSTEFEVKLQKAKEVALKKLKLRAYEKGGNAVVGIDLDYTEFTGNRIGLIANGTVVKIEALKI